MNNLHRAFAVLAIVALFGGSSLQASAAIIPGLSQVDTVANVTTGTDTQATATSSTQANVAEVKATRTLTVGALPANGETLTIGACVVTFTTTAGSTVDDTNCLGGAVIDTNLTGADTNRTPTQVASVLISLTNASSTTHGNFNLTASSSVTSVVITTAGTETSATQIVVTDGTGGDITTAAGAGANVTGVVPVAQVFTYTPSNVEIGDIFTAIINGTTINFTATAATVANVTAGLTAAINASAVNSAVTASDQTTRIDVTSDTAGTAFTLTKGATNRAAVAQQVTFTQSGLASAVYSIILDGVQYDFDTTTTTPTAQQVVEGLDVASAGSATVSCSEDNVTLTCVAVSAGTPFTASWTVSNYETSSGGGGHSSGGGGHRSNSDDDDDSDSTDTTTGSADVSARASLMAKIAELQAMLAQITGGAVPAAPSSFARDLDLGSEGADVTALQNWLIGKGYAIEAGATGYFGAQTQAALAAYQKAMGIEPAVGYFGPKTRASIK